MIIRNERKTYGEIGIYLTDELDWTIEENRIMIYLKKRNEYGRRGGEKSYKVRFSCHRFRELKKDSFLISCY